MARGLLGAVVFVLLMFAIDWFSFAVGTDVHGGPLRDYWWIYAALLAASAFMMIDVVDGATIARRDAARWSADGWMFAYAVGASWGVPMILIMWRPELANWMNLAIWGAAGALFGLWMNWSFRADQPTYHKRFGGFEALDHFYDGGKSVFDQRFGRATYYAWPLIGLGLIAFIASLDTDDDYHRLVVAWQLVLMTSILPRLQAPKWNTAPRIVGSICFIFALVATYMTSMP